MAALWSQFLSLIVFFLILSLRRSNLISGQSNTENDNLPGVAYDFRVHLDAAKESCFYQFVETGATLYVSFQVVRGGDGMAGFAVRHPNGQHVLPYAWKTEAEYEETAQVGGYYEFCVDNQFSRMATKLVNIYITSFKNEDWDQYTKEIEALEVGVNNFTEAIRLVDERMNEVMKLQQHQRNYEARDYQVLLSNYNYVQYWSMAQIIVVTVTATFQVYFVRKLFETKSPGSKTRA